MKDLVRCPNLCLKGKVKHYPNSTRALFTLVTCSFCKGRSKVTKLKAKLIEKQL